MPAPIAPGGLTDPYGHSIYNLAGVVASISLKSDGAVPVSTEGEKATFSAAFAAFLPVATPTDIFNFVGSATKTVKVHLVELWGNSTSISAILPVRLARRSTAGTLGSAVLTGVTAVPHGLNSLTATAVASTVGTANYTTLGTLIGYYSYESLLQLDVDTPAGLYGPKIVWDFNKPNLQPIVLTGVADQVTINYQGAAVPSGTLLYGRFVWTEEATTFS